MPALFCLRRASGSYLTHADTKPGSRWYGFGFGPRAKALRLKRRKAEALASECGEPLEMLDAREVMSPYSPVGKTAEEIADIETLYAGYREWSAATRGEAVVA